MPTPPKPPPSAEDLDALLPPLPEEDPTDEALDGDPPDEDLADDLSDDGLVVGQDSGVEDESEPELDEEMLPGEALEDDRWWAVEDDGDDLEDESSTTHSLHDQALLPLERDEGWDRWEDESQLGTSGSRRVGYEETVTLVDQKLELLAACDTGAPWSRLCGALVGREGERARVSVGGHELVLDVEEQGGVLVFALRLALAGTTLEAKLPLGRPGEGPALVLGRDLLAGRFLVDPSVRGLHDPRRP